MRLFVSVPLPDAQREHLQRALHGGRTTEPSRWHLTLAFLGEREDDLAVVDALSALEHAPFSLRLQGSGSFAGVEWVGVGGDLPALQGLAAAVSDACGLPRTTYKPHVTVARRGRALPPADYAGPPWTVTSFDLVQSVLTKPVEHLTLASFPLG